MKISHIIPALFLLSLSGIGGAYSQKLIADLEFTTRFDNREYAKTIVEDKTLFGLKAVPHIGVEWGGNSMVAGMDLTRHFGAKPNQSPDPELILYYRYSDEHFDAYAGIFQRNKMTGYYPRAFISGSTRFYDAVLEGTLLQYRGRAGSLEFACDWHSMITDTQREKFAIYSSGELNIIKKLKVGYSFMMHHFAGTQTAAGVVDHMIVYPYATAFIPLDRRGYFDIDIEVGWLQGFQNDRANENEFVDPGGFSADLALRYRRFSVRNTLYCGNNLMPYYGRYGSELYFGDPFYSTENDLYDRLELSWHPLVEHGMDLYVSSVHHYDGRNWGWQQLITFSVTIDRNTFRK